VEPNLVNIGNSSGYCQAGRLKFIPLSWIGMRVSDAPMFVLSPLALKPSQSHHGHHPTFLDIPLESLIDRCYTNFGARASHVVIPLILLQRGGLLAALVLMAFHAYCILQVLGMERCKLLELGRGFPDVSYLLFAHAYLPDLHDEIQIKDPDSNSQPAYSISSIWRDSARNHGMLRACVCASQLNYLAM
jgi:hypothetical protein